MPCNGLSQLIFLLVGSLSEEQGGSLLQWEELVCARDPQRMEGLEMELSIIILT